MGRATSESMITARQPRARRCADARICGAAYTGGVDRTASLLNKNYELAAYRRGQPASVATRRRSRRLQRDGVHRYQRPDDDIAFDPTPHVAHRRRAAPDGQQVRRRHHAVPERAISASPGLRDERRRLAPARGRADVPQLVRAAVQQARTSSGAARSSTSTLADVDGRAAAARDGVNTNWHVQFPNQWWVHTGGTLSDFRPPHTMTATRAAGRRSAMSRAGTCTAASRATRGGLVTPFLFAGRGGTTKGGARARGSSRR